MSGFRQYSQVKPPVNAEHLELCELAKRYLAEEWEAEFLASVTARVESGFALSDKQLILLQKMATGQLAEERRRKEEADINQTFNDVRDRSLHDLRNDMCNHDRDRDIPY